MLSKIRQRPKLSATIFGLIILIGSGGIFLLSNRPVAATTSTVSVSTGSITVTVAASGTLYSSRQYNAGFSSAGKVDQVYVKVGDKVKPGQRLARIDTTELKTNLTKAELNLDNAKSNLNSRYAQGRYTTYEIDQLKRAVKSSELELAAAQRNYNNAVLRSDITGIVAQVNQRAGDSVSASGSNYGSSGADQAVVVVIDPNSYQLELTVGESDVAQLKADQLAQITLDALGDKTYSGKVSTVNSIGTNSSGVVGYGVIVKLDKPDSDLKSGMSGSADIIVTSKENILTVPSSAIRKSNNQSIVQLMKDGEVTPTVVTVGIKDDSITEITSGLSEGDLLVTTSRVVTSGNGNMRSFTSGPGGGAGNVITRF